MQRALTTKPRDDPSVHGRDDQLDGKRSAPGIGTQAFKCLAFHLDFLLLLLILTSLLWCFPLLLHVRFAPGRKVMLPNMASNPDHRSRKLPRRTSSLDPLKQLHLRNASTPSPVQTPQTLQEEPVFIHPKGSDGLPGEPVPPGTRLRTKSKTWGARVSSLLPPLISPNADPNPQPVTRKTVMAAPTSPPAQPSPPPPYDPRESPTNRLNKSPPRSVLPVEPRGHPSPPRAPQGLPPTQTTMSLPELDMGMLSLSTSVKPQIMAPIPLPP
ncbi:hypothetical protein ACCO45_003680 [Purpureocillium lilacinum]|uniref:Uncharacterized protein n=1 Tax=Purpureocillium lilacinum TaxID=33203 RepID=A0ACC4E1H7_PURLI